MIKQTELERLAVLVRRDIAMEAYHHHMLGSSRSAEEINERQQSANNVIDHALYNNTPFRKSAATIQAREHGMFVKFLHKLETTRLPDMSVGEQATLTRFIKSQTKNMGDFITCLEADIDKEVGILAA